MPRILIADDEPDVLKSLSTGLKLTAWGQFFGPLEGLFDVDTAANGDKALKLLQKQPDHYHLLITGVLMPEMDGFEVLAALRQDLNPALNTLPVICMTPREIKNHEGEQIPYLWGDEESEEYPGFVHSRSAFAPYHLSAWKKDRLALCYAVGAALDRYPPPAPTDNRLLRPIKSYFRTKELLREIRKK
jgi:CheY-like chemotaxis protein